MNEEMSFGASAEGCAECERLKQSHSSAVNAYGEAVQRLGRTRGQQSKAARQDLRKATEDCERTKLELLSHKAQCPKTLREHSY